MSSPHVVIIGAGMVGTNALPVAVGMGCAFLGAYVGKRLMHKVTLRAVQRLVAAGMLLIGGGLILGWL